MSKLESCCQADDVARPLAVEDRIALDPPVLEREQQIRARLEDEFTSGGSISGKVQIIVSTRNGIGTQLAGKGIIHSQPGVEFDVLIDLGLEFSPATYVVEWKEVVRFCVGLL